MSLGNSHIPFTELDALFTRSKKIFFVGIGGIGMSSLAEYCVYVGKEVYGYDRERNDACKKLEGVAKKIKYCSTPDSASHMDMVIYTSAMDNDNFEIQCAIREGLPLISRANFLGYIMSGYERRIGVAGMHGQSTVTSLLAHIFEHADTDPTVFCGAVMKEFLSPYKFGNGGTVIAEACEYKDSFLNLNPTDAIILNIDMDHPDYFTSLDSIISSFQKYANGAERVFINADDKESEKICAAELISFGISNAADYRATDIKRVNGSQSFSVSYQKRSLGVFTICQAGMHSIYNSLCAIAVAHRSGVPISAIKEALISFKGSERRLEYYKKTRGSGRIYIDYAHHPREIESSLLALREMGYNNILCIFQSHTYSRTYALYNDFKAALSLASRLIITDIYPAREQNIYGITDSGFAADMGGEYQPNLAKIAEEIAECDNDAIVIMGAGDIIKLKKLI